MINRLLKEFLNHRRETHGTEDLEAVFDCVACQMLETELARAERLHGTETETRIN